jgi:hypothetical protein
MAKAEEPSTQLATRIPKELHRRLGMYFVTHEISPGFPRIPSPLPSPGMTLREALPELPLRSLPAARSARQRSRGSAQTRPQL